MNEPTIVGDTLDAPSCIASVPSDEVEASDHSAPSDTGSVQEVDFGFIQEMPQKVASPDLPTPMESIEEASEVSKLLEEAEDEPSVASSIVATKLLPNELVRDSSEEDGFEIEISKSASSLMSTLSIRDESIEHKRVQSLQQALALQRSHSVQSVRSTVSKSISVVRERSTSSKMSRAQSVPSQKAATPVVSTGEELVDEKSVDSSWGSYVDDDASQAPSMRRIKSRSIPLKRILSGKSVGSRSRSELGLEPIRKIEEEREEEVKAEMAENPVTHLGDADKDDTKVVSEMLAKAMKHELGTAASTTAFTEEEDILDIDEKSIGAESVEIDLDDETAESVEIDADDETGDANSNAERDEEEYVVSSLVDEDESQVSGFEVLEVPAGVNGLYEV
ncbi:MAG: hypothetical protein SGARI_001728 [Bacillariaceae sp.]